MNAAGQPGPPDNLGRTLQFSTTCETGPTEAKVPVMGAANARDSSKPPADSRTAPVSATTPPILHPSIRPAAGGVDRAGEFTTIVDAGHKLRNGSYQYL